MKETVEKTEKEALEALKQTSAVSEVKALRARYLGRKGVITSLLRKISSLPSEERPEAGRAANVVKNRLEDALKRHMDAIQTGGGEYARVFGSSLNTFLRQPDGSWKIRHTSLNELEDDQTGFPA